MINGPSTLPTEVGEYTARLDYFEDSDDVRSLRWFNGTHWSNPYFSYWPEGLQAQARSQISEFNPYWKAK